MAGYADPDLGKVVAKLRCNGGTRHWILGGVLAGEALTSVTNQVYKLSTVDSRGQVGMTDIELASRALPNRVREIRKSRGMTLDELAAAVTASGQQLHKSTLSKLESGDRRLTVAMAEAIARVLGVAAGDLSTPSDRALVLMVPVIGWESIPDALAGAELPVGDVVPVIGTPSSRLVAIRLTRDDVHPDWRSALCLDGVAVIRLGDEHAPHGVYLGQSGRVTGVVYHDGDRWQDCSVARSAAHPQSPPRIYGRVVNCILEPGKIP